LAECFEWFLSTLFDASLLELKAAPLRGFFLAPQPLAPILLNTHKRIDSRP
jgi:hypothetical protein